MIALIWLLVFAVMITSGPPGTPTGWAVFVSLLWATICAGCAGGSLWSGLLPGLAVVVVSVVVSYALAWLWSIFKSIPGGAP